MSDTATLKALRSAAQVVVVEAPAGCGKTHEAATLAAEVAGEGRGKRVLVLTHTHAAADTFAARCGNGALVEVRTIDSLITEIAAAYHRSVGLPLDTGTWVSQTDDGYAKQARLVARLLRATPAPARAISDRYAIIVFDEHQDATIAQSALVPSLRRAGARLRLFGDPMQGIYESDPGDSPASRWEATVASADESGSLSTPHRWIRERAGELGEWILGARHALKAGRRVRLDGPLPEGLVLVEAENEARRHGGYQTSSQQGRPIRRLVRQRSGILVLSAHNLTVGALRAYFGRTLPIWEGQVRRGLAAYLAEIQGAQGDPEKAAIAVVEFVEMVCKGFQRSRFGGRLIREASEGCRGNARQLPATLQSLARVLVELPNHRGAAMVLKRIAALVKEDPAFSDVVIDYPREFWDAVRLGEYDSPREGAAEVAKKRRWQRTAMPERALSTIHKAKGLEHRSVMVLPIDGTHFRDREKDRCALYVGMSRASKELILVVSRRNPSPLVKLG